MASPASTQRIIPRFFPLTSFFAGISLSLLGNDAALAVQLGRNEDTSSAAGCQIVGAAVARRRKPAHYREFVLNSRVKSFRCNFFFIVSYCR